MKLYWIFLYSYSSNFSLIYLRSYIFTPHFIVAYLALSWTTPHDYSTLKYLTSNQLHFPCSFQGYSAVCTKHYWLQIFVFIALHSSLISFSIFFMYLTQTKHIGTFSYQTNCFPLFFHSNKNIKSILSTNLWAIRTLVWITLAFLWLIFWNSHKNQLSCQLYFQGLWNR